MRNIFIYLLPLGYMIAAIYKQAPLAPLVFASCHCYIHFPLIQIKACHCPYMQVKWGLMAVKTFLKKASSGHLGNCSSAFLKSVLAAAECDTS